MVDQVGSISNKVIDYKDLKVWQKAIEVVCDITKLVNLLPSCPASEIIGKQMLGSSTSVCANIAEGQSSGTSREYNRILRIAYREAKETDNWLQVIMRIRQFSEPAIVALAKEIEVKNIEVVKMLSGLRRTIEGYMHIRDEELP
ncbi:four helix bundle protein [candidate division WOR-3 bacterium]|nr:four helix bundle protein [candidate division WOR-3 bacterium]